MPIDVRHLVPAALVVALAAPASRASASTRSQPARSHSASFTGTIRARAKIARIPVHSLSERIRLDVTESRYHVGSLVGSSPDGKRRVGSRGTTVWYGAGGVTKHTFRDGHARLVPEPDGSVSITGVISPKGRILRHIVKVSFEGTLSADRAAE